MSGDGVRAKARNPEELSRLFAERASTGDLDGLLELYEEEATLVGPDGEPVSGAEAIRERLEALLALSPRFEAGAAQALISGEVALLSNRWRMSFASDGGGARSGFEAASTELARRDADGYWRYAIDDPASAGLRPPAPPVSPAPSQGKRGWAEGHAFEQLLYEEDGALAQITLNRPERRNALSMLLSEELMAALERVRDSEEIKVLLITGAGESFCAGDDITEMGLWGDANQIMRRVRRYQRMADTLADLDKVTIAAVDGHAVGGGLEITMACDFVIATERSIWGMPEVDVGITPGWGGTTRMARLIGQRMTKEMNLLGALQPAARAAELGLWNRVVPNDALEEEVELLVAILLSKNQQALRQLKFIIDKGVEADLDTAQGFEALSTGLTGALNGAWQVPDADQASGIVSFVTGGEQWRQRRSAARSFWTEGPIAGGRDRSPEEPPGNGARA
jgi:enoyl-CoA hydratase